MMTATDGIPHRQTHPEFQVSECQVDDGNLIATPVHKYAESQWKSMVVTLW